MHRINQYVIKQEIGRGSFGAVHLAVDQHGQEYVRTSYALRWIFWEYRLIAILNSNMEWRN